MKISSISRIVVNHSNLWLKLSDFWITFPEWMVCAAKNSRNILVVSGLSYGVTRSDQVLYTSDANTDVNDFFWLFDSAAKNAHILLVVSWPSYRVIRLDQVSYTCNANADIKDFFGSSIPKRGREVTP